MGQENVVTVESKTVGDLYVIKILIADIHDSKSAYQLRDDIFKLVDRTDKSTLILDFSGVSFMGSVGLLALMGLRRHRPDSRLVVCGLSDDLREMFDLCRLIPGEKTPTGLFEVVNKAEDAAHMV